MTFPRARLVVSAALFLGWIGFLAFLAVRTRDPIIVSRPQLLVSPLHLIAQVKEKDGGLDAAVIVKEVLLARDPADKSLVGKEITVLNLPGAAGGRGPGDYLLALARLKVGEGDLFAVVTIPPSPGYVGMETPIYLATDEVLTQWREAKDGW